jgi:signal transduction histidine kinase
VGLWRRWRADLARPEDPVSDQEHGFDLIVPIAIVAFAQLTDPGTLGQLLMLLPAVAAFWLRGLLRRFPAELFAVLVIVPVTIVVGQDGTLEGTFFLSVMMVLSVSCCLGSVTRAAAIALVAAVAPWLASEVLAPESGIGWNAWAMAQAFTFLLGRVIRHQGRLIEQLEEAREALANQAVAEERRRIARELHDLAGHTLAAVVLHVTGARHVLRRDPEEAERALRDAEAVGRSSLDQIRATVAALRAEERGTDPALAGSADLPALVEDYRRAGLDITADIDVAVAAIDGPVGTAMHRITREALANVAQHAPANHVELRVRPAGEGVEIVVDDRGAPGRMPDPNAPHFGLVGMTERARALGGRLDAGPTPDGWRVEAVLPLTPATPEFVSG